MDEQCTRVVARDETGGIVVVVVVVFVVFGDDETAREGWEEGKGGGKGVFEGVDCLVWCGVVKKKAFLDGLDWEELEIPWG